MNTPNKNDDFFENEDLFIDENLIKTEAESIEEDFENLSVEKKSSDNSGETYEKQDGETKTKSGKRSDFLNEIYDWVESMVFALLFVSVIFMFLFKIVGVEGESMLDTLHPNDRIVVSDLFYTPSQGDIIVINKPNFSEELLVKRIIATGGQTVDINYEKGVVLVDGKEISEPYIKDTIKRVDDVKMPVTLNEGEVFVMGDNRNHSTDSRSTLIGTVDERYIMGRAIFRLFPFNKIGTL